MTRAERLKELLLKALPHATEQIESGEWGKDGAPYFFRSLDDGRQQLVVENRETGDRIGVVGADRDELLNKLEERL